jgi:hypothetical protein
MTMKSVPLLVLALGASCDDERRSRHDHGDAIQHVFGMTILSSALFALPEPVSTGSVSRP